MAVSIDSLQITGLTLLCLVIVLVALLAYFISRRTETRRVYVSRRVEYSLLRLEHGVREVLTALNEVRNDVKSMREALTGISTPSMEPLLKGLEEVKSSLANIQKQIEEVLTRQRVPEVKEVEIKPGITEIPPTEKPQLVAEVPPPIEAESLNEIATHYGLESIVIASAEGLPLAHFNTSQPEIDAALANSLTETVTAYLAESGDENRVKVEVAGGNILLLKLKHNNNYYYVLARTRAVVPLEFLDSLRESVLHFIKRSLGAK
ncbi:MAG: hypothetical protein DRJ40_07450 [Thermoprotei archaeon]|nr:MAG: hypothetical protein DRJ40_07450 [Thermoprotei archaeon]